MWVKHILCEMKSPELRLSGSVVWDAQCGVVVAMISFLLLVGDGDPQGLYSHQRAASGSDGLQV